MSVYLTTNVRIGGVVRGVADGELNLDDALEADLVHRGVARYPVGDRRLARLAEPVRSCESLGAHPGASAVQNFRAIQAALGSRGRVTLTQPGVYDVNDTLVVPSGTKFVVGHGVELRQVAGINKLMISNEAYLKAVETGGTAVTLSWTAGVVCTVNWTGHGKTTRDYVLIQGAQATGTITSITQANPGVITHNGHGLKHGDIVRFNVTGMTQLNGNRYRVVWINVNQYSLENASGAVDTTAFGAFSAGTWISEQTVFNNVFPVHNVVDANSFQVILPRAPTLAPGGTIVAYSCDTDIEIDGLTLDYNKAENNAGGQGTFRHAAVFGCWGRSSVKNFTGKNVEKYALNTMADADCRYENIRGYSCAEIFKHYGPSQSHDVDGIYGDAVDDSTTVQAREPSTFIAYQPFYGDIVNPSIRNVHVQTGVGTSSAAVVIYASDFERIEGVLLENIHAHSDSGNGFQIKNGDTFGVGKINSVVVNNLQCSTATATTKYAINVSANVDVLSVYAMRPKNQDAATSFFRQESQSRIRSLLIDDLYVFNTGWPSPSAAYVLNLNGDVDSATIRGGNISLDPAQGRFITIGTGAVRRILFDGVVMDVGNMFGIKQAGASVETIIEMRGCRVRGVTTGWDVRSLTRFLLNGNTFDSMSNGVIRPTTTSGLMARVYGEGNTFTSAGPLTPQSPATAEVYSFDIQIDPITLANLATTPGQYCWSTQAGAEGGPSVRGPSAWYALAAGASGANGAIT